MCFAYKNARLTAEEHSQTQSAGLTPYLPLIIPKLWLFEADLYIRAK